ncbi:MAG: S41 family peptidase [Nitrospirae bacterium]|nr:S41 family peptidase [Nitrospirota bacterium]
MTSRRALFTVFILAVGLTMALTPAWIGPSFLRAKEDDHYQKLKIFSEALDYVEKNYVEEVEFDKLVGGAIDGMLRSLDPHSSFMSKDMYQEMQIETSGQFGGLGMEITMRDGILTVVSPIEETPAFRAGIQAGDRILLIDNESTAQMSLMDALRKLRGPKGAKVSLSIIREGVDEPKAYTLTRDIIKIQSVKWADLNDGYGYLRVRSFQEGTSKEIEAALTKIEKSPTPLRGVILDLRNNPGGLLEEAVNVSDLFLEAGDIVTIKGRRVAKKTYTAKNDGKHPAFLMIVLVNKGSASASEIVASALRENNRALLLGAQTFGKGSVQTIVPLEDGSAIRVTTALYYTPKEHSLQNKGVIPDIQVDEKELYAKAAGADGKGQDQDVVRAYDPAHDPVVGRALELIKSWEIFSAALKKDS